MQLGNKNNTVPIFSTSVAFSMPSPSRLSVGGSVFSVKEVSLPSSQPAKLSKYAVFYIFNHQYVMYTFQLKVSYIL